MDSAAAPVPVRTEPPRTGGAPAPAARRKTSAPGEDRRLRVAIVGTVGIPSRYGGFETLAQYLVQHLSDAFEFTVYCSGPDYPRRPPEFLGARLVYLPLRANGPQSIPYDILGYAHALRAADVLLVLGVSGGLAMPLLRLLRKPTVLNIGGMEWQRSKWGALARNVLRLSEIVGVRAADVLVSDNLGISRHLLSAYGREGVLIEYGGDHVGTPAIRPEHLARHPFLERPYAFALARIQPDNNPELILQAFNQMPETDLAFVGTWSRSAYGRELKERYGRYPNLRLLEAIYDPEELNVIRGNCSVYVHGHSAGGTNPALVEAMHLGLPVAAFDVYYNRATTEGRAKYFRNVADLAALMLGTGAAEWDAMRPAMREIAARRYTWRRIAEEYGRAILEAAGRTRPVLPALSPAAGA